MRNVVFCWLSDCRTKLLTVISVGIFLSGCASNDKLFAQYNQKFCAANRDSAALEMYPARGNSETYRVAIVEAAGATLLSWLPVVYFDKDAESLSDETARLLEGNTEILQRFPNYQLSVRGYSNDLVDADMARSLSKRRIDGIVEFFQRNGVDQNRVFSQVYDEPVSAVNLSLMNNDEVNSRVEMILLDQFGRPAVLHQKFPTSATD